MRKIRRTVFLRPSVAAQLRLSKMNPAKLCRVVTGTSIGLAALLAISGCNKRDRPEVKAALAAAASAEAASDRDGTLRALESIPSELRTPEETQKISRLTAAKLAATAATSAEATGDRAAFLKALESIPEGLRAPAEQQKIAQLLSVAAVTGEISTAKENGDRATVKKAIESVKRLRLPVTEDEENDLAQAIAGVAIESELELARQKSDVDGIFLALSKMGRASFLSPDENALLTKCRQTLQELQALRGHLAKHDHEAVVHSADAILSAFPSNVEARKAFSESGLIFAYLEAASQAFSEIGGSTKSDAKAMIVAIQSDENLAHKALKLGAAEKHLAEALKLDPQYSHSLAMRAAVNATQNILAGLAAERIGKTTSDVLVSAERVAVAVFNDVNQATEESLKNNNGYSPARGYWDIYNVRYQAWVDREAAQAKKSIGNQAEQVAMLKALRNTENADLIDHAVRFLENADVILAGYVMPKGTWKEYSTAITQSQALKKDIQSKFISAFTGYLPVVDRSAQTVVKIFALQYYREAHRTKPILQKRKDLVGTI